jgi:hypothetical protein
MEFESIHDYPAGLDCLWAVFGRADYAQQKYRALGATAVRLRRFDAGAELIEVELERDVPVDPSRMPTWARRFVGDQQTLRHRSSWRRTGPARAAAEIEISPLGLPVRARGLGTITETAPDSTRLLLAWRVDCTLPLVGIRVERLFAKQVRAALDEDHVFTLAYMSRCGGAVSGTNSIGAGAFRPAAGESACR